MKANLDRSLSVQVFNEGQTLCRESYIDCSNYHFMRPILRRIEAVPSSYSHRSFYASAIEGALSDTRHDEAKVTISGTADYSWLLVDSPLIMSLGNAGILAHIQIVDACPTPTSFSMLASNELDQHTVRDSTQNITQFLSNEIESDLIVTDAFLTQFSDKKDRLSILDQWSRSLKLGGYIITTAQVARDHSVEKHKAENTFINNTAELYSQSEYPEILQLDNEEFTERIRLYASSNASRIYESEEEIISEVVDAGLKITHVVPMSIYSKSSEKILSYCGLVLTK